MKHTPLYTLLATILILLTCTLSACGDDGAPTDNNAADKPGPTAHAEPTDTTPAKPKLSPSETFARQVLATLKPEDVQNNVLPQAFANDLTTQANASRGRGKKGRSPWRLSSTAKRVYSSEGDLTTRFVQGTKLSPLGQLVLETLEDADSHALSTKRYHVEKIRERLRKLEQAAAEAPAIKLPTSATAAEVKAFSDAIQATGLSVDNPSHRSDAIQILTASTSPIPAIAESANAYKRSLSSVSELVAKLELTIADGLHTYAWDQRYRNKAWFRDIDFEPMNRKEVRRALRRRLARDVIQARKGGTLEDFVKTLPPPHPQYELLRKGLAHYRKILDAGGWKEVRRFMFSKGVESPRVRALKRRLHQEGFYPPNGGPLPDDLSSKAGDDLVDAVKLYQESHQMDPTGKPKDSFWKSLNISVEHRIEQIKVTMDRWRESRIGDDTYYVHVNIPDFHAEAWKDGEREIRFRIVVGNTDMGCDINDKRWKLINATPLQSKQIKTVIVNPYWNVPDRIWKHEILPLAKNNPNYYERHNYECVRYKGKDCGRIRQAGGKGNALGKVKFIFPNRYNTYMHDTPSKQYFKYPIRAYSHGCMRVHEPLKFAEYLLKGDDQWDEDLFNRKLNGKKEYGFPLKNRVPIHIEYYTVRADDQGRMNFLADVYRYDKYRLKGEERTFRRCTERELEYARDPAQDDGSDEDNPTIIDGEGGLVGGGDGEPPRILTTLKPRSSSNSDSGSKNSKPIPGVGESNNGGAASGLKPKLRKILIPND